MACFQLLSASTCSASAVMEAGEFFCASKSYDSTCYESAMIEMGEYCCVLPTPIGFDVLCVCSDGNGRVFLCFQILWLDLLCVCNDRDGRVLLCASNSYRLRRVLRLQSWKWASFCVVSNTIWLLCACFQLLSAIGFDRDTSAMITEMGWGALLCVSFQLISTSTCVVFNDKRWEFCYCVGASKSIGSDLWSSVMIEMVEVCYCFCVCVKSDCWCVCAPSKYLCLALCRW